jgi:hypothetical protein
VVQAFLNLATAFGLSTSAGLNAYIPLLVVALLAKFTQLVTLSEPYDALTSWWVIGIIVLLLVVELLVDKIPAVDTINDIIQTVVRPTAGAILFAATTNTIGVHPVLAAMCGVILAGGVHVAKAGGRPVVTATTGGTANPILSTVEDAISLATSVLAVVAPYIVIALLLIAVGVSTWWYARRKRKTVG